MQDLSQPSCGVNSFGRWQPIYAEHGIATFPVEFVPRADGKVDKKPAVRNYGRMGLNASAKLVERFGNAPAIGFTPGLRSNVTIADIDEPGNAALERAIARHGDTPVIVVSTATGKHHAYYRFNGECRKVRPEKGVALDVLGHQEGKGNFVVAAPSLRPDGQYRFLRGSLGDLAKLPAMRNVPRSALITSPALEVVPDDFVVPDGMSVAPKGTRDITLWRSCMRALGRGEVRALDELLAFARQLNQTICLPPQLDEEVMHAATSAWQKHESGENWFGRPGLHFFADEAVPLIDHDQDLFVLISFIRATQAPNSEFMLANGMAERWKWRRQRFAAVRARALATGEIYCVRKARQNVPALYRRSRP
jgi:hypothetical protein